MHVVRLLVVCAFVNFTAAACCGGERGLPGFPGRTVPGTIIVPLGHRPRIITPTEPLCAFVRFNDGEFEERAECINIFNNEPVLDEERFSFVVPHDARVARFTGMLTGASVGGATGAVNGTLQLRIGTPAAVGFTSTGVSLTFAFSTTTWPAPGVTRRAVAQAEPGLVVSKGDRLTALLNVTFSGSSGEVYVGLASSLTFEA